MMKKKVKSIYNSYCPYQVGGVLRKWQMAFKKDGGLHAVFGSKPN